MAPRKDVKIESSISVAKRALQVSEEEKPFKLSFDTSAVQQGKKQALSAAERQKKYREKFMLLNETWNNDENEIDLSGFKLINQFKRKMNRSGGVAIYEKEDSNTQMSESCDLYKYEDNNNKVRLLETRQEDVGDICTARATIDGVETLIIAVYVSPNATTNEIHKFLTFNLMAYSPKLKGLFDFCDEEKLYEIPIIIGGDFNTSLEPKDKFGKDITTFMKDNFDLDLTNNSAVGSTRSGSCIDGVFTRYVNVQTKDYISYFSYHKPLLSAISSPSNVSKNEK